MRVCDEPVITAKTGRRYIRQRIEEVVGGSQIHYSHGIRLILPQIHLSAY